MTTFTKIDPNSRHVKHLKWLGIILLIAAAIIGGVFLFFFTQQWLNRDNAEDPLKQYEGAIVSLGETLEEVGQTLENGEMENVRNILEARAEATTNPIERGTLLLILANLSMSNDIEAGVLAHKEIAADENLPSNIRATAVLGLALFYYTDAYDQDLLTDAIFSEGEPYVSMRDEGAGGTDRKSLYASLLSYADSIHATPIANAYLARYWAREASRGDSSAVLTAQENAEAHLERTALLLSAVVTPPYDLNPSISTIQSGIAKLYLAAHTSTAHNMTTGLYNVRRGFTDFAIATNALLTQQKQVVSGARTAEMSIDHMTHELWKDTLTLATDIADTHEATARELADTYATYIASAEGASERLHALDSSSDIAPLVAELVSISEMLENALQVPN